MEIILLLLFWGICGIIGLLIAWTKGASPNGGLWLGILLGPLGVIIAGAMAGGVRCACCGEYFNKDFKTCRFCGHVAGAPTAS